MPEASFSDWNQFLRDHPDAHLLQTGEWGELKSSFGWRVLRVVNNGFGAQILFRKLPLGFTIAYIPKLMFSDRLSVVSNQFLSEVETICRKRNAIFLKIEPDAWKDQSPDTWNPSASLWAGLKLKTSLHNIQPPRTIIIDIRGAEDDILARMKQKTRYNIRLATKKDVHVRTWNDLEGFHRMLLVTGGRDGFGVHSLAYYRRAYELFHPVGNCELLVAEYENRPLAALMVFAYGRRAWYVYGASNDEERNRMPAYLLQWEAMRWAKAHGCEEYDLWGVPDEDEAKLEAEFESRHDGLWGVYRFKRGFGGELKRSAQALDHIYNPFLYKMYLWRLAGRESA